MNWDDFHQHLISEAGKSFYLSSATGRRRLSTASVTRALFGPEIHSVRVVRTGDA